jgi:L-gulono-1,4-lactone dehydrogenase
VAAEWRNWAGDQACRPARIEHPATREEVAAAVLGARERGLRVKVVGSGHSFTEVPLTDGVMLVLDRLTRAIDADRASGLVKVEAGILLREFNRRLDELGLAMENLGDIDVQTLAGAISTATHGTGARFRNISAEVEAIELVDGEGDVRELEEDDDLLRAARVGIGALGAITAVTLRTVPAFTIRRVDEPRPLAEVLGSLDELTHRNEHFEFFVFPYAETALTIARNRTDEPPRRRGRLAAWANDILLENYALEVLARAGRTLPARNRDLARLATRLLSRTEKVVRSHEAFASERRVRFTEMEYAVPREHGAEAVRRVLELIREREVEVFFPIEFRLAAADDAFLSPAHERPSAYVAVHQFKRMPWREYFEAVEEIMRGFGGRPHWGKRHFQDATSLRPLYPRWDDFQRARAELDPAGTFGNAYTDRVLAPLPAATGT